MRAIVRVTRRPKIADPPGLTTGRALADLGYGEVAGVRIDRVITIELTTVSAADAKRRVEEMCERLLANPVLEDYSVTIEP